MNNAWGYCYTPQTFESISAAKKTAREMIDNENKTTTEIRQTRGDKLLHCDVQPNRHHNKPDSQIHIAKGKGTARKTLSVPAQ